MMSKLKALGGCSSHHLQGAGASCGGPTIQATQLVISVRWTTKRPMHCLDGDGAATVTVKYDSD